MPRGIYDRKAKKKKKQLEEKGPVDPVKLQFPKPDGKSAFMIMRNRARNIEHVLKKEK